MQENTYTIIEAEQLLSICVELSGQIEREVNVILTTEPNSASEQGIIIYIH